MRLATDTKDGYKCVVAKFQLKMSCKRHIPFSPTAWNDSEGQGKGCLLLAWQGKAPDLVLCTPYLYHL